MPLKILDPIKNHTPQSIRIFLRSLKLTLENRHHKPTPLKASLTPQQKKHWEQNGFLILKSFFTQSEVQQVNQLIDELWTNRSKHSNLVIDAFLDQPAGKKSNLKTLLIQPDYIPINSTNYF